jgi:hypothetical protein
MSKFSSLSFLRLADWRQLSQGEQHDLFAGQCADVVVQTQHFDSGDFLYHGLHGWPRSFHQMTPHLLEQIPSFIRRQCFDQVLLGRGQNTFEPANDEIIDRVNEYILGPTAHVFLLKAAHALRNGALDFTLSVHEAEQYS